MTILEKANISKVLNNEKAINTFCYLYGRWQDEKEYEDFNDYIKAMMNFMPNGATLVKGTKRPFGVVINYGGATIHIALKLSGRYCSLTAKTTHN